MTTQHKIYAQSILATASPKKRKKKNNQEIPPVNGSSRFIFFEHFHEACCIAVQ